MKQPSDLSQPAVADLRGVANLAELAGREGRGPGDYALMLAEGLRRTAVPLDVQRERLAALAACGAHADKASAETIAAHSLILEALFERFALEAHDSMHKGGQRGAEVATAYLAAALKAQRASLAALSALKVLRDAPTRAAVTPAATD